MITLTRKAKKEATDSMFSRYPISLLAQGKGASPQARPGEREGCTSTSFAHRRGSMQLHGRFCKDTWRSMCLALPITLHENSRPEHNNTTADAQRDREGSAAHAGPRRRSPRPHACLLTDVGRNLSSVPWRGGRRPAAGPGQEPARERALVRTVPARILNH